MKHPTASESDPFAVLKQGVKWMWSLGDYGALAKLLEPYAQQLAVDADVRPATDVLDVAAGNGNFALACAARGARVVACDLTPSMVELGRERIKAAGLDCDWREADAEELPFSDDMFDVVGTVFGAMFAPRPQVVAAELVRVVRPGGVVAMANYSGSGFLAAFGQLLTKYSTPSRLELPSPFAWGDDGEVRRRFQGLTDSIEMRRGVIEFQFPSVDDGLEFWERTNPPHIALRSMLPPEAYARFMEEAREVMERQNAAKSGGLVLESGYLTVLAKK